MNIQVTDYNGHNLYRISDIQQFLLVDPNSVDLFLSDFKEHYAVMQDYLVKMLMMSEHIKDVAHTIPMMDQFYWLNNPDIDSSLRILLPIPISGTDEITIMTVGDLISQISQAQEMAASVSELGDPDGFVDKVLEGAGIAPDSELADITRSAIHKTH